MKLTINKVLDIARDYCLHNLPKINLDKQVQRVRFYEMYNYTRTYAEAAWEIYIKIDLQGCEGLERILIIVSDEEAKVEFWEDNNGIKHLKQAIL